MKKISLVEKPKKIVICQHPLDVYDKKDLEQLKNIELSINGSNYNQDFKENITFLIRKIYKIEQLTFQINFPQKTAQKILNEMFLGIRRFQNLISLTFILNENDQYNEKSLSILGESISQLIQLKMLKIVIYQKSFQNNELLLQNLSNLVNLNELGLEFGSYNKVSSKDLKLLANILKGMNFLNQLSIIIGSQNDIRAVGAQALGLCFKSTQNLKYLKIRIGEGNQINFDGFKSINQGLSSLKELEQLELIIDEVINSDIINLISKSLNSFVKLSSLIINLSSISQLSGLSINSLDDSLKKLSALIYFDFNLEYNSSQNDRLLKNIVALLKKLSSVKTFQFKLNCKENSFGSDFALLYECFSQLKSINNIKFFIPQNTINTQKDITLIECEWKKLSSLKALNIQMKEQSFITKEPLNNLFKYLSYLTNLRSLELILDQIGEQGQDILGLISFQLKKLTKLESLVINIKDNIVDESSLLEFGENIKHLTSLRNLKLDLQNIQNSKIKKFLEQLNPLHQIQELNLVLSSKQTIQSDCLSQLELLFQQLQTLNTLNFEIKCSSFTNQISQSLNKSISFLKNIKSLSFILEGDNSYSLQHQIGMISTITQLKYLDSLNIILIGKYTLRCSIYLCHNSFFYLRKRDFYFCFIKEDFMKFDPQDLQVDRELRIPFLQIDSLYWNNQKEMNFTQESLISFSNFMSCLDSLSSLSINIKHINQIKDDITKNIFESIQNCSLLQKLIVNLDLNGDTQDCNSGGIISSILQKLAYLQFIDIQINRNNRVEMSQMLIILNSFQSLKELQSAKVYYKCDSFIDFQMNRIVGDENQMVNESNKKFIVNLTVKVTQKQQNKMQNHDKFMEYLADLQFDKLILQIEESNTTNQQFMVLAKVLENQKYLTNIDLKTYPQNFLNSISFLQLLRSIFNLKHLKELSLILNSKKLALKDIFIYLFFLTQNQEFCNNLIKMNYMITTAKYALYKQSFKVDQFLQFNCSNQWYFISTLKGKEELQESDFQELSQGLKLFNNISHLALHLEYNLNNSDQDFWKNIAQSDCFFNLKQLKLKINQKSSQFSDISQSFSGFLKFFENIEKIKISIIDQSQANEQIKYSSILEQISSFNKLTHLFLEFEQDITFTQEIINIFKKNISQFNQLIKISLSFKTYEFTAKQAEQILQNLKELKILKKLSLQIINITDLQLKDIRMIQALKNSEDQKILINLLGKDVDLTYNLNHQIQKTQQISIQLDKQEYIEIVVRSNQNEESIQQIFQILQQKIKQITFLETQSKNKYYDSQTILHIAKIMKDFYSSVLNFTPNIQINNIKDQKDVDILFCSAQNFKLTPSLTFNFENLNKITTAIQLIKLSKQTQKLENTRILTLYGIDGQSQQYNGLKFQYYKYMMRLVVLNMSSAQNQQFF